MPNDKESRSLNRSELSFLFSVNNITVEQHEERYAELDNARTIAFKNFTSAFPTLAYLQERKDEYGIHPFEILECFEPVEHEGYSTFSLIIGSHQRPTDADIAAFKALAMSSITDPAVKLMDVVLYREYTVGRTTSLGIDGKIVD